jgi:hypothetical protein
MNKALLLSMVVCAGMTMLSGCTGFNKAIGKAKSSPDEFQVVVRAPLTLPPNFDLRPSEDQTVEATRNDAVSITDQVLTRSASTQAVGFDSLFAFDEIVDDIRTLVDEETIGVQIEKRLPVHVLFGGQPNVGPNLVADEETRRIRRAISEGDSLTATPTPAFDPVNNTPLAIE